MLYLSVITKKLVDGHQKKLDAERALQAQGGLDNHQSTNPYIDGTSTSGSFRVGYGDKRRSWLGLPTPGIGIGEAVNDSTEHGHKRRRKGCC